MEQHNQVLNLKISNQFLYYFIPIGIYFITINILFIIVYYSIAYLSNNKLIVMQRSIKRKKTIYNKSPILYETSNIFNISVIILYHI